MDITHIDHIGIAVNNLEESVDFYKNVLGLKCISMTTVEDQFVKVAIFKLGETKIELLESTSENGAIQKFINRKGEGIHHIAYGVNNIEKSLDDAVSKNISLIDKEPRTGAEGGKIAFLHPKSSFGVLTELCEHK
ncbi:methylmalonyl-CoA epimerase [Flammeovirga aprica]|uniref:Methylmalonyl-CoA epimerase n=1 Tax=Flammeovirga aprica JL-4 TaxID=694437 RepID=A0A7X9XAR3_9BACT|nr:methylmalonyl-CoA epimerase [Flammeovirga aprica]NME69940.1 methylmalonyl-CoA epimerase [Flammeovirga aprica JL-4]